MEEHQEQGKLKVFSREVLPIRLIDIRATLGSKNGGIHFVAPTGWNFHVISHTWSTEICDLSEHIGNLILGKWWMPDVLWRFFERANVFASWLWRWWMPKWYNQLCKGACLRGKPAYKELMEFLQLLADDQVTHIWFDMLCINQNDDREKSREIPHMGAYYSYSKGCYVSVHGIARGYGLWSENRCGSLARWFDRVWTLQEFALPESFLVITELNQNVQKIVTGLIRTKSNSSVGFCRCCILKDVIRDMAHRLWWPSRLELLRSSGFNIELHENKLGLNEELFPGLTANDEILCGQSACAVCGTSSLVRRGEGTVSGRAIYMVEREAYLFLLYVESLFPLNSSMAASSRTLDLMRSLKQAWDTWMLLDEVASRQCTRDEDRVLGILGLLGIGGEMQLRTGQSLEQQLVQVAKICDPDLLIKICAVDLGGGVQPGMSWAPDFRGQASGRERICGLTLGDVESLFGHHPGGPFQCCGHLKPARDILQQPLDMAQVSKSMAELDSRINRFSDFKRQVKVLDVNDHGVMLEGKVVVGRVMPYEMLRSKDATVVKAATVQVALLATRSEEDSEKSPLWLWQGAGGAIESPKEHTPTHCIHFQDVGIFLPLIVSLYPSTTQPVLAMADAGYPSNAIFLSLPHNQGAHEALLDVNIVGGHRLEDKRLSIEMELWFVLLGNVGVGSYNVAMVCVGRKGNREYVAEIVELHKVGMFVLPSLQIGDALFGSSHGLSKCVVGGFAEDLGKLVNVHLARGLT